MECKYYLLNPTKNYTVLVESQFSVEVQPSVAKKLLEHEKKAEQVGFIINEKSDLFDIKIRMCGGEFCGNACMAAAVVYLKNNPKHSSRSVRVSVSGCEHTVNVDTENINDIYSCVVDMPESKGIKDVGIITSSKKTIVPIVEYKGISHIIFNGELSKEEAQRIIKQMAFKLKCEALGIMISDNDFKKITPLVYVSQADTMYWENSCASGSAAVGEYLLYKGKTDLFPLKINEPGGCLTLYNDKGIKLQGICLIEKYDSLNII